MLQRLDLGTIRAYEQARDLSIDLLKEWLFKYKFKSWKFHRTTNPGTLVTDQEKQSRAQEIAEKLSDNNLWHSHGRLIGLDTLKRVLRLEIDDYTNKYYLRKELINYNNLLKEFVAKNNRRVFLHSSLGE